MPSTMNDVIEGITTSVAVKAPCAIATTGNITLSGEQTIDGVLTSETRVLVKDQTTATQNGIYKSRTSAWTREPDFDGNRDVAEGTIIPVNRGTTNADTMWRVTNTGTITIDTTSLAFERAVVNDSNSVSFLQSGTGAVARTLQAKERETFTVTDFGTITGTNDNVVVAAAFAAGAGKRIHFPPGTYAINDLTWPANTLFTGEGVTSIIKKRASGDIGTLGALSETRDLYFDLNGTNYTGRGFVISTGSVGFTSWRHFANCHFIDSYSYAIEYTQDLAGYGSLHEDCYFTMSSAGATPYATPAVKLPTSAETNGNRHFLRCMSGSYILVDLGGCNNVNMSLCLMAPPLMGASSQKVVISNCRMVDRGDSSAWTVRGTSHVIVGNTIAQLLITFDSGLDELFWDGNATPDTTFTDNATGDANDNKIYLPSKVSTTPTWTGSSSNPAIGDGQLFGSHTRRGEDCRARITLGIGSTTTLGSGYFKFTLPYTPSDNVTGTAVLIDASTGTPYTLGVVCPTGGSNELRLVVSGTGYMTGASPIALANGDALYIDIDYRIA